MRTMAHEIESDDLDRQSDPALNSNEPFQIQTLCIIDKNREENPSTTVL
jgi:hypothetical protein